MKNVLAYLMQDLHWQKIVHGERDLLLHSYQIRQRIVNSENWKSTGVVARKVTLTWFISIDFSCFIKTGQLMVEHI